MDTYRIVLTALSDPETEDPPAVTYRACAPELGDCSAAAASRAEAVAQLEQEIGARLSNMKEQGVEPPTPIDAQAFDGRIALEVSPGLHREIAFIAKEAGVEIEVLVGEIVSRGIGRLTGLAERGRPQGGGRKGESGRRGRGLDDRRYHGIMEDRASFIEYVRQLERDGGQGRGGGGRRGRR